MPPPPTFNGVPGGAELWLIEGVYNLVYTVPNTQPPVRMIWVIPGAGDVQAITGSPNPQPHRVATREEAHREGAFHFGSTTELRNTAAHPFEAFLADFEREAAIRPWLRDPEVLALTSMAVLEGREVSEAELKSTQWWRTRNDAQRAWSTLVASNPAEARRVLETNRLQVANDLRRAGIVNAPPGVVDLMAERLTQGDWSPAFVGEQIRLLADPAQHPNVDSDLRGSLVGGGGLQFSREREDEVRAAVGRWLGPVHGQWRDDEIRHWATRLLTDPNAEAELVDLLKGRRMALFPEYKNDMLTYEDIAGTWRGVWRNVWGADPNEEDPLFERVVRLNERGSAEAVLRQEGLQRRVTKVIQDALSATAAALGPGAGVRRAV